MPHITFDSVDEARDFEPVAAGQYLVEVSYIDESVTRNGDEMWNVAFRILDGEHAGRLVYDRLVFTGKALSRVKLACSRLGVDVTGSINLTPAMLLNRTCLLTVEIDQYEDSSGALKASNRVPWDGYAFDPGQQSPESPDGGVF